MKQKQTRPNGTGKTTKLVEMLKLELNAINEKSLDILAVREALTVLLKLYDQKVPEIPIDNQASLPSKPQTAEEIVESFEKCKCGRPAKHRGRCTGYKQKLKIVKDLMAGKICSRCKAEFKKTDSTWIKLNGSHLHKCDELPDQAEFEVYGKAE